MVIVKIEKVKETKNCVIKRKLKFKDYRNYLAADHLENKTKIQRKLN